MTLCGVLFSVTELIQNEHPVDRDDTVHLKEIESSNKN